jgi:predicted transcriptional regulator
MKPAPKSANSWLQELMEEKFTTGKCDVVPEGWITLSEMAKNCDLPMTTMNSRIMKLMKLNVIQREKYKINTGRGITEVWHYYKK